MVAGSVKAWKLPRFSAPRQLSAKLFIMKLIYIPFTHLCFVLQLIGVALVAVGIYAYITLRDYLNILGDARINAPAIVLIVFGVITFIIAALGCIGACKESPCLLFTVSHIT